MNPRLISSVHPSVSGIRLSTFGLRLPPSIPRSRHSSLFQPIKTGAPATDQITVVPRSCPHHPVVLTQTLVPQPRSCPIVPNRGWGDARSALDLGLWTLVRTNMKSNQIKPDQGGGTCRNSLIPICVYLCPSVAKILYPRPSVVKTLTSTQLTFNPTKRDCRQ